MNDTARELINRKLKTSKIFCFLFFIFYFLLLTSHFSLLFAANTKKELSEIEEKLRKKRQQVQETIKQEKSILSEVEQINKAIKRRQQELKDYEKRISQTQTHIKNLEEEISLLAGRMEQRRQDLKERLKVLYKQQYGGKALILIAAGDYQDLLRKSRYMSLITYMDKKMIDAFGDDINEANVKKKELEVLHKGLEISKANVQKKKNETQSELDRKDRLLASVRSKRDSYEKMVKELEESSERIREMIEQLDKEKAAGTFAGKDFGSMKRRLTWPVEGEVIVPFGKYLDPQYNISVFKNGIEIRPVNGGEPKAVADGSVVYADWFKGYGLLLIINHGSGYHTLYGHLSEIFHKSGDIINKGTVVGKTGESGLLNVPTLYFEIRFKGKPVDPMQWLKKKNSKKQRTISPE
ncbi:MAG: peptidoglycan DD-metalloendopeptidase family protein [Nitrospirae bacterium]|nr:peptidoglycan DD-metalloendopeptidase family protein [Nitrospirota bacterium]